MRTYVLPALFLLLFAAAAAGQTLIDIATDVTDSKNLADSEPSIAVNPLNSAEIAVVTFSEGWSQANQTRAPIWMSQDGGWNWKKKYVLTAPSPASNAPGDQKLAYDSEGNLFVAELGGGLTPPDCFFYRRESKATDSNWIPGPAYGDDQPMLQSLGAQQLLSSWLNFGVNPPRSMSEWTPDLGVTLTQTAIGSNAYPNRTTRIAAGISGSNYFVYAIYKTEEGSSGQFETATFRVVRSADRGVTWNTPGVPVHPDTVTTWYTDKWGNTKDGGKAARARSSDAWIAVNPANGTIWVVYCNRDSSTLGQIYAASSTDGGATWNKPVRVSDGTLNSAFPEVAVTDNGTVGVMYVDYDDSGSQTVYTHRFARSFDSGKTWDRVPLQSFKTQEVSNAVDGFLWGDYEGLTAFRNTFYGAFTGRSIGRAMVQLDPIFFQMTGVRTTVTGPVGAAVVDGGRPYVFVRGSDDNVWLNWWSGSEWKWSNQRRPEEAVFTEGLGVTLVQNVPWAFLRGNDGLLWVNSWDGSTWKWTSTFPSNAGGVMLGAWAGATTAGNRPYAFMLTSAGGLEICSWDGSRWNWTFTGASSSLVRGMGAVTIGTTQPHVYALDSSSNLWECWLNSSWTWTYLSRPSGINLTGSVGAVTVDGKRPYVFAIGSDGNLWLCWWTGSSWIWSNQGKPPGLSVSSGIGATVVNGGQPYAFVRASDGNMWLNYWNGTSWNWSNNGRPDTATIGQPAGVITVDGYRPYAFVIGSDKQLWVRWWTGSSFLWASQGAPP